MTTVEILNELNSPPDGCFAMTDSDIARRLQVKPKTIWHWRAGTVKMVEVVRCALLLVLSEQREARRAAMAVRTGASF